MKKTAVYAGSFCPFTKGHEDIVGHALPLFDEIAIAIGQNPSKEPLFSTKQRIDWIKDLYKENPKIKVFAYEGLTVDFCKNIGANYLIRGVRNFTDIAQEMELAEVNRELDDSIETILFFASPQWRNVSSSLVRELWSLQQNYTKYVSYKLPDKK